MTTTNAYVKPQTRNQPKSQEEQEIEQEHKKRRFRPPMTTAVDPSHDEHIKKLCEKQKRQRFNT